MKRTRLVSLVLALALTPVGLAHADEATARKLYDDGERAYNLGEFPKAAELFRKAFEEWPEPAFLFNLAQTYRQTGDCKQAAFFYKRFIALKEQDTKKPLKPERKAEVEQRIAELDECIKREMASKPPTELDKGGTGGTGTGTGGTGTGGTGTGVATGGGEGDGGEGDGGGDDGGGDDGGAVENVKPHAVSLRLGLGAGKLGAGGLNTKLQFATALTAGYPLSLGPKFRLDLGAAFSFTPVPYTTAPPDPMPEESGTGKVIGLVANVGPTFEVGSKISLRADVGIGAQVFAGLSKPYNPFTGDNAANGALSSFMFRTALSAEYAVTSNISLTLTPIAFSYAKAPDGLVPAIHKLTTIAFFAGIGYQQ